MTADVDRRRRVLFTILTVLSFRYAPGREPPLFPALRQWLGGWRGIGRITLGMARQGYDVQLTRYNGEGWRATFYPEGRAHSLTAAVGSAWARGPGRQCSRRRGRACGAASVTPRRDRSPRAGAASGPRSPAVVMRPPRSPGREPAPLPERIALVRLRLGLSQPEFAARIGVHRNSVIAWERGRATPAPAQLRRIASAAGLTVERLRLRADRRSCR